MQNYELRCRKAGGAYLAAALGEFESLLDALEGAESLCVFDVALDAVVMVPLPSECESWAIVSADGMELAAKRG